MFVFVQNYVGPFAHNLKRLMFHPCKDLLGKKSSRLSYKHVSTMMAKLVSHNYKKNIHKL